MKNNRTNKPDKDTKRTLKVLVACEESQAVCKEFRKLGHEAYSCDIIECSGGHPEWHIKDDVLKHLDDGWDIMIAFPPCTHICLSGQRWFMEGRKPYILQKKAISFIEKLWKADIPRICIENPIGVLPNRSILGKPSQITSPHFFGHKMIKTTCFWLKNLPPLIPTEKCEIEYVITKTRRKWSKWFYDTSLIPYKDRGKERSKTFKGIAEQMAKQWSKPKTLDFFNGSVNA